MLLPEERVTFSPVRVLCAHCHGFSQDFTRNRTPSGTNQLRCSLTSALSRYGYWSAISNRLERQPDSLEPPTRPLYKRMRERVRLGAHAASRAATPSDTGLYI